MKNGLASSNTPIGTQNLTMGGGDFTIEGKDSTLFMNNNKFILNKTNNVFTIQNLIINGSVFAEVQTRLARINLVNVTLNAPITVPADFPTNQQYNMTIQGNSIINGFINSANASFSNSAPQNATPDSLLIYKADAFSNNTRLNIQSGIVNLAQSDSDVNATAPREYNFFYMYSSPLANFTIAWDIFNEKTNTIRIHESASSGQIKISDVIYAPISEAQIDAYIADKLRDGAISYEKSINVLIGDTRTWFLLRSIQKW